MVRVIRCAVKAFDTNGVRNKFQGKSYKRCWCNRRVYDRNNLVNFLWKTRKNPPRPNVHCHAVIRIISTKVDLYIYM